MKRNLVTAFVSVAGSRVVILFASAVITPVLVRLLTPEGYGEYATLMAVFGLLMILVSSGITNGTRKFLAEERDLRNWQDHVFGFYARLAAALSVLTAVVLVVAAEGGVVALVIGEKYVPYFYPLAVLVLAAQFRAYVRRALMGLKLEHVSEPVEVLHNVSFGVFAIALVVLGYGVVGVLVGHVLSSLLVVVVGIPVLARHLSLSSVFRPVPSSFPRREMFNFNHLATLNVMLVMTLYHVDVLMLEAFTHDTAQVGFYRAALVLTQLLWLVPRSVEGVMVQSTSNLWEQGETDRINDLASRATRYTLLFTALLALGLGALAADFVPLYYGDPYRRAVGPILLLLPGTLGFAVARPLFAISQAKGELRPVIAATAASAGLNFVLNLALIPRFGMVGAAVATSVGYGSLPAFHVRAARRLGYRPLSGARPVRIAVTAALSAIPIFALSLAIDRALLALAVVPVVGFVAYAVLSLATNALDLEELFEIGTALPSPVGGKVEEVRRTVENADGLLAIVR